MSRRCLRSSAAALLIVVLASPAFGQPTPQARAHAEALFREGVKLADEKALDQACAKFDESQRLDPQPGTLLYLATCHEQQGKTATAWIEYNRAATLASRAGQQDRADLARKRAGALESSLSYVVLEIDGAVAGLVITLDGEELGAGSLGTKLPVDPGEHSIEVRAPNRTPWSSKFSVSPGEQLTSVAVPKLASNPATQNGDNEPKTQSEIATAQPPPAADRGSTALRTAGFVGLGVGVIGLAAGTYFGLRARSLWNQAEDDCSDQYCHAQGLEKTDDAKRAALISTLSFGLGIAATGAGVICLVASRPKARESSRLVLSSHPTAGGAMVSLWRTW